MACKACCLFRPNRLGRFGLMAWRVWPLPPPNEIVTKMKSLKRVRPTVRQTADRCHRRGAVNCWPTAPYTNRRRRTTVSAIHSGSVSAMRFSRSSIFFIGDFFGDDFACYPNSSISCLSCVDVVIAADSLPSYVNSFR